VKVRAFFVAHAQPPELIEPRERPLNDPAPSPQAAAVHLSYDRMASFLAPYGNRDALEVARNLDKKIEDLLRQAAA
jgi:hypothetical protein